MASDGMYKVNQFVNLPDKMMLSNAMYEVKSYFTSKPNLQCHSSTLSPKNETNCTGDELHKTNHIGLASKNLKSGNELTMEQLKHRQENIFKKLNHIREKLAGLKEAQKTLLPSHSAYSKVPEQQLSHMTKKIDSLKNLLSTKREELYPLEGTDVISDFVIAANPQHPPYSLLLLRNVLESRLRLLITSSSHSSVNQVNPSILRLFKGDETKKRENHDVAFTVIWKNQPMTSLMVNPLTQCEILGEANILRYFSRLFPAVPLLKYESLGISIVSEMDDLMDRTQSQFLQGNNKERQAFLKSLNSKLETSSWISGEVCGLCDVFLCSTILQLDCGNTLPRNVSTWFKKVLKDSALKELGDNLR